MSKGTIVIDIRADGSFKYQGHIYQKTDILQALIVGKRRKLILRFWQHLNDEGLNIDPSTYTNEELKDIGETFLNPVPAP